MGVCLYDRGLALALGWVVWDQNEPISPAKEGGPWEAWPLLNPSTGPSIFGKLLCEH